MVTGFGLRPYRRVDGAALNFMVNTGQLAYNQASSIGQGDVIIPLNTGYVGPASTNSNPILGVWMNCNYANPLNTIQPQTIRAWAAPSLSSTTVVTAQYVDDPAIVFEVIANGTLTQSSIGFNANFASNHAPTTAGFSTLVLDTSTVSTLSTLPLRIVELSPIPYGNSFSSANPVMGVVLNTPSIRNTTGI